MFEQTRYFRRSALCDQSWHRVDTENSTMDVVRALCSFESPYSEALGAENWAHIPRGDGVVLKPLRGADHDVTGHPRRVYTAYKGGGPKRICQECIDRMLSSP